VDGLCAALRWCGEVAVYLSTVPPIRGLVDLAVEVLRLLNGVPAVGPYLMAGSAWVAATVLVAAGAAVASLVGLVPY
jgi:hypothetical protein